MNPTARTVSSPTTWWTALLLLAPALTATAATAQWRGGGGGGGGGGARGAISRPAAPAPRSTPTPVAKGLPQPGASDAVPRSASGGTLPRPPRDPRNAITPTDPAEIDRRNGTGGGGSTGNRMRPPSPVTLTLDEVCASPEEKAKARKKAEMFFGLKVPAKKAAPAVRKVTALRWHKTLDLALVEAKKQHKPVLYIQALGDLKGFT